MERVQEVKASVADKIFIISEPRAVEALRETYIARYPNGKTGLEIT